MRVYARVCVCVCVCASGVDELIVLGSAPGTSHSDYSTVDVAKRVLEVTGGQVSARECVCGVMCGGARAHVRAALRGKAGRCLCVAVRCRRR